jgi:Na+-driven multidrug efflux pump
MAEIAQPPAASLGREARDFLALAAPMVVSRIGVAAMGIADGVMLARYSAEQLAVSGLADALVGRALDVAMVFVTAGLALAAQARAGAPSAQRTVGRVWHNALVLAVLCGVAGLAFGWCGTRVLQALGQQPQLAQGSGQVVWILSLGMLPALVALATAGLLEALGRPLYVAVVVVLANVLNIALNMLFIGGWAGAAGIPAIPAMGAAGAAWSTTLVRLVLAVVLVWGLWRLPHWRRYSLRGRFGRAEWQRGQEQRARGWAGAANVAVLAGLSLTLPVMAGWLGTATLAQVTALWLALAPTMVVAWGLGDAAGMHVARVRGGMQDGLQHDGREFVDSSGGNAFSPTLPTRPPAPGLLLRPRLPSGRVQLPESLWPEMQAAAMDLAHAQQAAKASGPLRRSGSRLGLLTLCGVLAAILAYGLAPEAMVRWAAHDPALVASVLPLLPLGLAALAGDALAVLYSSMLRSLGVLRGPFVLHVLTGGVLVPLAWWLAFPQGLGAYGLIAAQAAMACVRALALVWMYGRSAAGEDRRPATLGGLQTA